MEVKVVGGSNLRVPARAGDAGFDLLSSEEVRLEAPQTVVVNTGVRLEIPDGFVGIVKEKSGLASKGLAVGGGVIDSGYRGEVKVILRNMSRRVFWIKPGDAIAQLLFLKVERPVVVSSEQLSISERGSGGFGSTGGGVGLV